MRIRSVPIEALKPHPTNPRRGHDTEAIARSIKAFGHRQPIVVWEGDGYIVVGHGRFLAAKQIKAEHDVGRLSKGEVQRANPGRVPVHFISKDELTAREAAAYRLADNKSAEGSEWDEAALLLELDTLEERERELAGFDQAYRDELESRLAALDGSEWDPEAEWEGMPEYVSEDQTAHRSILVHFPDESAIAEFSSKLGVDVPKHDKFMWFPHREDEVVADKRWVAGEP